MSSNEDLIRKALGKKTSTSKPVEKKRSRRKPKIKELKIDGSLGTRVIDFDEVKVPKERTRKGEDRLFEWTSSDFASFIRSLHFKYAQSDWNLNWLPACTMILKVKDDLAGLFGFCDNVMLRDYIDFYFKNYFDSCVAYSGDFYITHLQMVDILEGFFNSYDYKKHMQEYLSSIGKKNIAKVNKEISNDDFETAFILHDHKLLCLFGIVLTINWLMMRKQFEEADALQYVLHNGLSLYRHGQFHEVETATEKFSPYPNWMVFQDINNIIKKVHSNISMHVDFKSISNSQFEFFRR